LANKATRSVEPAEWGFVRTLLEDPERTRLGTDRMIAMERETANGSPDRDARMWSE